MVKEKKCAKCIDFEVKCIDKYQKLLVKQQESLIRDIIEAFPDYKKDEAAMMKFVRKISFRKELNRVPLNDTYKKLCMENGAVYYYDLHGRLVDENEKLVGYVVFENDSATISGILYPDDEKDTDNSISTLSSLIEKLSEK